MKKQLAQMAQIEAASESPYGEAGGRPRYGSRDRRFCFRGARRGCIAYGESSDADGSPSYGQAAATPAIAAPRLLRSRPRSPPRRVIPRRLDWLNRQRACSGQSDEHQVFHPEFRADANYSLDYNHPKDDSLGGSTETFRSDEWQLEQISAGGDIRIANVRGASSPWMAFSPRPRFVTTPAQAAANGI